MKQRNIGFTFDSSVKIQVIGLHDLQINWTGFEKKHSGHDFLSKILLPWFLTAQKMKFSIKDFFIKYDQIHRKLRIWSDLLKKLLMENFISFVQSFHRTLNFDIWLGSECTSEYIYSRILLAY